ncbi:MAG: glycosyltransferase family 39 protein, partial [Phycisphaerae bacterium]|nr:glycosyltransferase family 39 protein [Phycisphaerae bacterium]
MRIPRLRLLIWFVLALGIVVAHRGSASVWLVGAVLALAAACLLINGRLPFRELDRLIVRYRRVRIALARPVGRHPWLTAAVLFVVVAVATASPWGRGIPQFGVHPWHDSASYLLEARMILEGHLVRPGLQHPEFFRTLHVLVTPIYCSKYPPGYPVIMATGLLAGHVEWVPPVLVSLAAAAVWLFGRRIVGRWSGLLAACAFATCPMILWLGTIHLSSTLSMLLGVLILGLWSVGHIRGRRPGLRGLVIGLLLSGMMLTRPFDAAALGVLVTIGQLAARGKRENGGSETPFLTVKTTGETPVPQ